MSGCRGKIGSFVGAARIGSHDGLAAKGVRQRTKGQFDTFACPLPFLNSPTLGGLKHPHNASRRQCLIDLSNSVRRGLLRTRRPAGGRVGELDRGGCRQHGRKVDGGDIARHRTPPPLLHAGLIIASDVVVAQRGQAWPGQRLAATLEAACGA